MMNCWLWSDEGIFLGSRPLKFITGFTGTMSVGTRADAILKVYVVDNVAIVSRCYCRLHVTLPNRVSCFILSNNFKLPFLCEFLMDLPET
jgi:hypothetical protein